MANFETVATAPEIAAGTMKLVDVAGDEVVVVNVDGKFFAFANECTHAGGPLIDGDLEGDKVTCPWHATVFNVMSGAPLQGPGREPIPTYEVRIEGDEIQLAKS